MILKGYCDGSGSEKERFFTLAGYVASTEIWDRFNKCWIETLSAAPRPCSYLHMKEANAQQGAFKEWSKEDVKKLLRALINDCISPAAWWGDDYSTSLFGVFCSIEHDEFEKACQEIPFLKKKGKAAVCAEYITDIALRRLPQKDGQRYGALELYFDQNEPFKGKIKAAWNETKNKPAREKGPLAAISRIDSVEMRVTPGVQAADYLAWHINRWQTKKDTSPAESQWANILAKLSASNGVAFNCEKLMKWYGYA